MQDIVQVFGGLAVACCPLVPKFAGSNLAEAVGFLRRKIPSTPSFGGEVKPSVPWRRFVAGKRPLNLRGSRYSGKITTGHLSRPQFHFRYWDLSRRCGRRHLVTKVGTSKGGGTQWHTTRKNLPRMQCARHIPVTWLGSGSCWAWPSNMNTNEWSTDIYYIYRVSKEECARLREGVPYAKLYRYNPKNLSPKWNGYGDNG